MIEEQIKSLLNDVCPGKVFLEKAPHGTSPPYICFFPVSSVLDDVMSGQSGYIKYCFQVDAYSKRYIEASNLIKESYQKLQTLGISQVLPSSEHDSEAELYRETFEFFY